MSGTPPSGEHVPVLLEEVLTYLVQDHCRKYIDGTFGRGGHSQALLARMSKNAQLWAVDRDPEAIKQARILAAQDERVSVVHGRFSQLNEIAREFDLREVDGVLLDLGVSSPQLDDPSRGFSFRASGPLDMRMNPEQGESAEQWINHCDQQELVRVLRDYGEERFAKRIAASIVAKRPISTTHQLADVVAQAIPARFTSKQKHPATQTFQAIRMHINEEMNELELGLHAAFELLANQGRLAVISFHSLEDRRVKHVFRQWTQPPPVPRQVPLREDQLMVAAINIAGPIKARRHEVASNPRARSATLRVIEKRNQTDAVGGNHG